MTLPVLGAVEAADVSAGALPPACCIFCQLANCCCMARLANVCASNIVTDLDVMVAYGGNVQLADVPVTVTLVAAVVMGVVACGAAGGLVIWLASSETISIDWEDLVVPEWVRFTPWTGTEVTPVDVGTATGKYMKIRITVDRLTHCWGLNESFNSLWPSDAIYGT